MSSGRREKRPSIREFLPGFLLGYIPVYGVLMVATDLSSALVAGAAGGVGGGLGAYVAKRRQRREEREKPEKPEKPGAGSG